MPLQLRWSVKWTLYARINERAMYVQNYSWIAEFRLAEVHYIANILAVSVEKLWDRTVTAMVKTVFIIGDRHRPCSPQGGQQYK
ncbi:hypothetical protein AWB65_06096 [Caballeronia humi]|uniref:Uncharacterized protein n=1 Tax=Caballeronia humi TaxID=326474 RepID=A0A158J7U4_9BURK|nr:hypothetical protein AWB65_06096 [Caballeronia humi]